METFTDEKDLSGKDLDFPVEKKRHIHILARSKIDKPIRNIIDSLNSYSYCFTLQSCWGHFVLSKDQDEDNLEPLSEYNKKNVDILYRIAYLAMRIRNCPEGIRFLQKLRELKNIDKGYIQFGCADWFWKKQINSYVIQVEPERHKTKDSVTLDYPEALHVQKVRDCLFGKLEEMLRL